MPKEDDDHPMMYMAIMAFVNNLIALPKHLTNPSFPSFTHKKITKDVGGGHGNESARVCTAPPK